MVQIKLTNTRTRSKDPFEPIDPNNVRMYVCGPTVYDRAHLGNARPVVVFDVLYRLLRHVYGEGHVTYVRNFTDVDDKINATAQARKDAGDPRPLEALIRERTDETIRWYHEDMDALGALRPDREPRATEWIGAMVAMIEELIAKGHAYAAEGHVLFRVRSYADYGTLSGRSVDDMMAGARVEVAPYKEDPLDFVLWKPSTDDLPGWDSPWGRGRPGWHIECSAMSRELLGAHFDIHGGGLDLQFPHHENEIAQSCCADPGAGFANVWMHNEMLLVDGEKMSKSLGNFVTVRDALTQSLFGFRVTAEELRVAFLLSHYRSKMDLNFARLNEARRIVKDFATALGSVGIEVLRDLKPGEPLPGVVDSLADDLDTPTALRRLQEALESADRNPATMSNALPQLYASQRMLGLDLKESRTATDAATAFDRVLKIVESEDEEVILISHLLNRIDELRRAKDFARADQLRAALVDAGAEVKTTKEGTSATRLPHFDPERLRNLA